MSRKRYKSEQIINLLSQGRRVGEICRSLGISERSCYRWRSAYGGMKLERVKRLKELEQENSRLKRAVAELTLDKLILKEAAEGNFLYSGYTGQGSLYLFDGLNGLCGATATTTIASLSA